MPTAIENGRRLETIQGAQILVSLLQAIGVKAVIENTSQGIVVKQVNETTNKEAKHEAVHRSL